MHAGFWYIFQQESDEQNKQVLLKHLKYANI